MHIRQAGIQRFRLRLFLLAIFVAGLSGCVTSGGAVEYVKVDPLPELPKDRMKKPNYGQKARAILLEPPTTPTTK